MSDVRAWLLGATNATLCTLAAEADVAGFPFGSLAPFALRADGTPFVLISAIAQHTRNLARDPRCSLFVRDPAGDSSDGDAQATWRVTVLARAERLGAAEEALEELYARYAARVPDAPGYGSAHDFSFWTLRPVKVRAIGGFGAIRWLPPDSILCDPHGLGWREAAAGVTEHMNADHEEALVDIAAARTGKRPERARITAVESAGFLVRTGSPDSLVYVPFGRDVPAREARDVFVELARTARAP
jgi:heme oxygenase (biliverdin-IX-beta and delta-forming)